MARFAVGQPITTREPTIEVDAGMSVGIHRFQLEVVTHDGRVSPPDTVAVRIVRLVLDPTNPVRDLRGDVVRDPEPG